MQEFINFAKNYCYIHSPMKRIGILMDSIFSIGGVQRVTAVIAKELAKDYDVTIITLDHPSAKDTSLYGLEEADIHYRFFSYPKVGTAKEAICKAYSYLYRKVLPQTQYTSELYAHSSFPSENRDALTAELLQGNYDIIIGDHAPLAVRLASCRKQLKGCKLIGWIHNSYEALFGKDSLYIGPELSRHYEYQLAKLDATIVLSRFDAAKYPFPTRVIYNPLTLEPGKPSEGTSHKFLAVGRLSYLHKGFDLLIEAFHIFAQKNQDWTLDIVGEGPEEAVYRQMISKYGLESRIMIHPFTKDIQKHYTEGQVYVLSSRWEGFGLVIVEAMAHGLPVVSSDLPTSKEIMDDFGLYFENGNVSQLAQCLEEATHLNWQEKSQEALRRKETFAVSNIIKQWKELIES